MRFHVFQVLGFEKLGFQSSFRTCFQLGNCLEIPWQVLNLKVDVEKKYLEGSTVLWLSKLDDGSPIQLNCRQLQILSVKVDGHPSTDYTYDDLWKDVSSKASGSIMRWPSYNCCSSGNSITASTVAEVVVYTCCTMSTSATVTFLLPLRLRY